jgi:anti-sigma-K factor RskA/predicted Ser/Thr protein kinase
VLEVPGYRIEGVAGRGGWSVVYRAIEEESGTRVAIKTIASELAGDPAFQGRFRRECEILASLEHPNVPAVRAAGDGWVAMQWVEGTSLRELVPLAPARAAAIVAQVAAALDLMHARGLVHRDVKPGNVLVGPGDRAYLTDFGLTKEISPDPGLTAEGRWLGTVDFAAPEQIRGRPTDGRSDVYSLACVLGFAVTGSVPYPRPTPEATMHAHLYEQPPRLPASFGGLGDVLVRALAKDPSWRFRSAGELARAAVAATGREPAPAGSPSPPAEPAAASPPAWSWRAVATVAAVVVLVIGAVVVLGDSGGAGDRAPVEDLNAAPPVDSAGPDEPVVELGPESDHGFTGAAFFDRSGTRETMLVEALIDDPPRGRVYEIWLYNSRRDALSLGTATPDRKGVLRTELGLPHRYADYAYVDVSLEPKNGDGVHSGRSLMRGAMSSVTGAVPGVDP